MLRGFGHLPRRFGLKSLFALLTLVAILLSWRTDRQARDQRHAAVRRAIVQQEAQGLLGYYPQREAHTFKSDAVACAAALDGSWLMLTDEDRVRVFDLFTGLQRQEIRQPSAIWDAVVAPDHRTLVMLFGGAESPALLWDLPTGTQLGEIASPFPPGWPVVGLYVDRSPFAAPAGMGFVSAAFAGDGKTCALGCEDGTILIWDTASGQQRQRWLAPASRLLKPAFSPDGTQLAISAWDGTVLLWDLTSESLLGQWKPEKVEHGDLSRPAVFSPDGHWLLFPDRKGVRRVPCDSPEMDEYLELSAGPPCAMLFPNDARKLVTAHPGRLILRDVSSLRPLAEINFQQWKYGGPAVFRHVIYLADLDALLLVEMDYDQSPQLDYWSMVRIVPLSQFRHGNGSQLVQQK